MSDKNNKVTVDISAFTSTRTEPAHTLNYNEKFEYRIFFYLFLLARSHLDSCLSEASRVVCIRRGY